MEKDPPYPEEQAPSPQYSQPSSGYPPVGQPPPQGYAQGQPPPQGYAQGQPPPQGYPQGQPQQTTVVLAQPAVVLSQQFREVPVRMQCPACQADIMTAVGYDLGLLVWLLCGIMFLFGLWLCCFIPFCIDQCKDVTHTCPNCQHVVGKYNRLG